MNCQISLPILRNSFDFSKDYLGDYGVSDLNVMITDIDPSVTDPKHCGAITRTLKAPGCLADLPSNSNFILDNTS